MGDEAILDAIQDDLPLTAQPFASIGEGLGLSEDEVVSAVRRLQDRGIIREVSAILDGARLGFHSSLVAMRLSEDDIDRIAGVVNAHPRVSHNYLREHEYNLWFTIAAPATLPIEAAVAELLDGSVAAGDLLVLPAVRTYKLRVKLPSRGFGESRPPRAREHGVSAEAEASAPPLRTTEATGPESSRDLTPRVTDSDRRLLAVVERPLPIVPDLWSEVARRAGVDEPTVIESIRRWKSERIVRRVSGVIRHRELGYAANGMGCYAVPIERADAAGKTVASLDYVSHCYYRDAGGRWPYPFFAMIHARRREECLERAQAIARGIGSHDHLVLFSTREYKKERVRYFEGVY